MKIKTLEKKDFNTIKNFYTAQINLLERKEFFFPYQDEDIRNILTNKESIMQGVFMGEKLIGLSAIDGDLEYSKILNRHINYYYPFIPEAARVYEYSGVVTDSNYRGQGVAAMLYSTLSEFARNISSDSFLCAVVQLENQNSLNFFFRRGFILVSVRRLHNIDFGYLIKNPHFAFNLKQEFIPIDCLSYTDYEKYLPLKLVGRLYKDRKILLSQLTD